MSDQLLLIFRICLLALVYLTFFRVLRAVWVELRTEHRVVLTPPAVVPAAVPRGVAPPLPAPGGAEPESEAELGTEPEADGAARLVALAPTPVAGTVFDLQGETTIGRAPGCGVMIDDARVSKLHARVFHSGGRWVVEDLGSTNGTLVNDQVLELATSLEPGDRIQVADHVLELM